MKNDTSELEILKKGWVLDWSLPLNSYLNQFNI